MKRKIVIVFSIFLLLLCFQFANAEELTDWEKAHQEKSLELETARLEFEREQWEWEKAEEARKEYEGGFSSDCDVTRLTPTLRITGHIYSATSENLRKDLGRLFENGVRKVILIVSSGGGNAFAGLEVADVISNFKELGMEIEGQAYGLVASAAVPIYCSCSVRVASRSALFMIHEASFYQFIIGFKQTSKSDVEDQKIMFDKLEQKYVDILIRNSKIKDPEVWQEKIKETTWFFSEEAMEWGLVDTIK